MGMNSNVSDSSLLSISQVGASLSSTAIISKKIESDYIANGSGMSRLMC